MTELPLYFPTSHEMTEAQWDKLPTSDKVMECLRYLPLIGYERGIEYHDLTLSAMFQLRVADDLDLFDIKHMVDSLWKWRRYSYLETVATAAESQATDVSIFADELEIEDSHMEHLRHLLHASNAYGAIDWGPYPAAKPLVTPEMLSLSREGYIQIREAATRELKKAKKEHAEVLRRLQERNPDLGMRAAHFSNDYLQWRLDTRLSRSEWREYHEQLDGQEEEEIPHPSRPRD